MAEIISINSDDMRNLGKALAEVGTDLQNRIIASALNRSGDQCFTELKRIAAEKSGRSISYAASRIDKKVAYGTRHEYTMVVRDWWAKITAGEFRAREMGESIAHRAWAGGIAHRSFIISGVAFHRPDKMGIKPLYGPNVAREVERAMPEVREMIGDKLDKVFMPRVMHELDRAVGRTKAKYGL
jgi:hypothetical protein